MRLIPHTYFLGGGNMKCPYCMKICSICGKLLVANSINFHKGKEKYGVRNKCKICVKEYDKQYREKNKEHLKELNKKYREEHKVEIKENKKQYYEENKEYFKRKR